MLLDRIISIVSNVSDILKVFDSFQEGVVVLQSGKNVIEITTRKPPVDLWISLKEMGDMPVCNGNLDKVSYTLKPDGFVLYADVVSDTIQIEWHAIFSM